MGKLDTMDKIKFVQAFTDPGDLVLLNPFARLVHYIAYHVLYDLTVQRGIHRFPKSAIRLLMSSVADLLTMMYVKSYMVTVRCGRITLDHKDIRTALFCQDHSLAFLGQMIPKEWRGYLQAGFQPTYPNKVNQVPVGRPLEALDLNPARAVAPIADHRADQRALEAATLSNGKRRKIAPPSKPRAKPGAANS